MKMLESVTFFDVFDIYRMLIGSITAEIVFVAQVADRRERFSFRLLAGSIACILFGLLYIPVCWLQRGPLGTGGVLVVTILWWLLASVVSFAFVFYCYEITPCSLMFHGLLGCSLQHFTSVILQYLICKKWFPTLQTEHTFLYILVTIGLYAVFEWLAYFFIARRIQKGSAVVQEDPRTFLIYGIIILIFSLVSDVTSLIFHLGNDDMTEFGSQEFFNHFAVPYYCIVMNLILCAVIFLFQYLSYRVAFLQEEKKMLLMLQKEKEQQYLFTKENVDLINQKCHDLKRQIRALKLAKGDERERIFAETEKAVQFYDAAVKTGNDVLDTILTEKSIVCSGQGIRFTCNVQLADPDRVAGLDVIDLYTLLSNALDNAIECVSGYGEEEKRTISVSVLERGSMLNLLVDNYFEGEMKLKDGLPLTSKEDKNYHGYGVKSMRMIAGKYDGDMRIRVKDHTFSLQIMLPLENHREKEVPA